MKFWQYITNNFNSLPSETWQYRLHIICGLSQQGLEYLYTQQVEKYCCILVWNNLPRLHSLLLHYSLKQEHKLHPFHYHLDAKSPQTPHCSPKAWPYATTSQWLTSVFLTQA